MSYTVLHPLKCECGADLTKLNSVTILFVLGNSGVVEGPHHEFQSHVGNLGRGTR